MYQRPAVTQRISYVLRKDENRNAHLLGVNALALDTTTLTANPHQSTAPQDHHRNKRHSYLEKHDHRPKYHMPGGILYTGGRDGMIAAWDLHLESPVHRDIPGETPEQPKGLPPSTFRQSFNHHTDWVNDIVLCHNGETLVSASSDRTVKLVRPHSHNPTAAHIIGTHGDYVKTLAYASGPGWLASGGLDKTVHLWDIKEGRNDQFGSLGSIPETSSKASIYALACNPMGTVLATGSPEKIIRVWDPRSGQRITKFAGHTDNIRAILISESGDTILSASSDTTIKLWSLTAQRCITTFTMHTDSVWSLYSDHPQLSTFYGGGKDGLVTKTEINRYSPEHHHEYDDEDPGQCVVICKADIGVARLVAHDNARIWTATSSSSIYQWPDIPTRVNRSVEMAASIEPANVLKMNLNESTFTDLTPEQYYPTSTVYSAASLGSIYVHNRDKHSQHSSEDIDGLITPIFGEPENIIHGEHGLVKHSLLNNRRQVVTEDKCGEVALWDLVKCVQLETFPGRKLNDVVNEINTIESVPTWCTIDTRIGALTVHLDEARCFDAEVYVDEIEETPDPDRPEDQRIVIGKWVLNNLFERYVPVHIEEYEKEAYRQQHQDEVSVPPSVPMTVVTNERNEVVDGSAVAGDHNTSPDVNGSRPTINTTPEGLKPPATSEQPASSGDGTARSASASPASTEPQQPQTPSVMANTNSPRQGPVSTTNAGSKLSASGSQSASASPNVPSTPLTAFSPTTANSGSANGFMGRLKHSVKKLARAPNAEQRFDNGKPMSAKKGLAGASITIPPGSTAVSKGLNSPSMQESAPSPTFPGTMVSTNVGTGTGVSTSAASSPRTMNTEVTGTASLGAPGSGTTKPDDEQSTLDTTSSHSVESMPSPVLQLPSSTISVRPPHPPFTPPTYLDCPIIDIPAHIPVIISELSREASSSVDLYRGSVGTLGQDYVPLVQVIPTWLLEVLLKNMIPMKESPKVSFVLRPHHDQDAVADPGGPGRLGELPGGNPRLTAPRMLRIRKVTAHVVDKLGLNPPENITATPSFPSSMEPTTDTRAPLGSVQEEGNSSVDGKTSELTSNNAEGTAPQSTTSSTTQSLGGTAVAAKSKEQDEEEEFLRQESLRPENWLEILCNDQVLTPTMTLATIRAHYWKTGSDVVLTYRYKQQQRPAIINNIPSSSPLVPIIAAS
ncbi:hypothetical protein BGZ51_004637 [Haplosporangium sp. Z 767]|nr:hypothetical protein BGZ51_004637 [Haplosporangium sp. Z 767]KAF9195553.1 hypothetical protein BGZ50_004353 [Haplosporangium sp. Z 11]